MFACGVVAAASGAIDPKADSPASVLGGKVAEMADDPAALLTTGENAPDTASEGSETARLRRLPAVSIPIQDDTLANAIIAIATASGMNFIAPRANDFSEHVTLATKVGPWHLLRRLGDRYGFTMAYRDGIWEFNRSSIGARVPRVYTLKYTNLDVYRAAQNSFSTVGTITQMSAGDSRTADGGMIFSAQTQRIIQDVRNLIGLPPPASSDSTKPADGSAPATDVSATGSTSPSPRGNVIYIPDANALYVVCTRAQHELVAGYLGVIDHPPRQIHIEARFFETTWDPKTILGINPENFQPRVSLSNLQAHVDLSRFSRQGDQALLSMNDVALQMNALRSDSRSRLVQDPTVVTANNHEVYFSVGDEEPFVSSNNIFSGIASGGFGATTASIAIRRIGTSVNVVPTIFEGENGRRRIRLVVRIEVGALKGFRQIDSVSVPVVTSQKYEYTTYVEDNQALAFGGLSGIGETDGVSKVPVAGDVPVVGYLFKSRSREVHQRNLVAYIIARVIDEPERATLPPMQLRDPANSGRTHPVFPE